MLLELSSEPTPSSFNTSQGRMTGKEKRENMPGST
jgi:hypothetical protein